VEHQEDVEEPEVVASREEKLLLLSHIVTKVCSSLAARKTHWSPSTLCLDQRFMARKEFLLR
jgi:hypothetical protein